MRKRRLTIAKTVFAVVLLVLVVRMAGGEICSVPTPSMEPTVLVGDRLWVDKVSYGAKLPERWADIPVINVFTWITSLREADEKNAWGYHRLPGFASPKIGDIIVFQHPEDAQTLLVKRITRLHVTLAQRSYFVEGDNKDKSRDSRTFGYIPESLIIGRVGRVLFSYGKDAEGKHIFRSNRFFSKLK